jgi:hypothetical protein
VVSDPLAPPGFLSQVESWNGTSWTEVAEVNTARSQLASKNAGSSTAGLIFGGVLLMEAQVKV